MNSTMESTCNIGADKAASLHDSARGSPELLDDFHALVQDINSILGPSSGINSDDVDVEKLKKLMTAYESNEQQWSKYAFADASRAYTRNLVDQGNGKANLVSSDTKFQERHLLRTYSSRVFQVPRRPILQACHSGYPREQ